MGCQQTQTLDTDSTYTLVDFVQLYETADHIDHHTVSIGIRATAFTLDKAHKQVDVYTSLIDSHTDDRTPLKVSIEKGTARVIHIQEASQSEISKRTATDGRLRLSIPEESMQVEILPDI